VTPRSDAAESRQRIIEAALSCFLDQGYNNTTMDDIVAESGLSKGSLYWHFDSKEGLLQSATRALFEDYFDQESLAQLEQIPTATDRLRAMARGLVTMLDEFAGLFNLFVEFYASSAHREQAAQLWLDLLVEYKEIMVGVIEEGIESGEFRPVDPEQLVWAVMAAYDGLAVYVMMKPDLDLQRISEAFVETLLRGLKASERGSE
jgi:AcrR family transcriptional regulator